MNIRRIIGIIICIAGISLIIISNYITGQVNQGKEQISSAESSVSQGKKLFGLTPYSKAIGDQAIINPAESKIAAGKEEVSYYEGVAKSTKIAGVVLIVAGALIVLFPSLKKKRK